MSLYTACYLFFGGVAVGAAGMFLLLFWSIVDRDSVNKVTNVPTAPVYIPPVKTKPRTSKPKKSKTASKAKRTKDKSSSL